MFGITESFAHPTLARQGTPDSDSDALTFGFPGAGVQPGPPILPKVLDIKRVSFSMPKAHQKGSEFRLSVKVTGQKYEVSTLFPFTITSTNLRACTCVV